MIYAINLVAHVLVVETDMYFYMTGKPYIIYHEVVITIIDMLQRILLSILFYTSSNEVVGKGWYWPFPFLLATVLVACLVEMRLIFGHLPLNRKRALRKSNEPQQGRNRCARLLSGFQR